MEGAAFRGKPRWANPSEGKGMTVFYRTGPASANAQRDQENAW